MPGADEKNRASPAKKGGPVFQYAENRRNSYKSYKPDAAGLFGHAHDARPAGGKRAGTKENPELFQMEKLGVSGGRGWIRTTEALSSRFTVCPHWPLGNTPLFCFCHPAVSAGDLFILPQRPGFVNRFFGFFGSFFRRPAPGCCVPPGSWPRPPAYCIIPMGFCQRPISILFALRPRVWFCDKFFYSSCLFSGCIL